MSRPTDPSKKVLNEYHDIGLAVKLISLGARTHVLQEETGLSREKIIRLYKEVAGVSPSKGMLPFSEDWYIPFWPNVQSSLYMNIYNYCLNTLKMNATDSMLKALELLNENMKIAGQETLLSVSRAWMLLRLIKAKVLDMTTCSCCGGKFVTHAYEYNKANKFTCVLCNPPLRIAYSVKTKRH